MVLEQLVLAVMLGLEQSLLVTLKVHWSVFPRGGLGGFVHWFVRRATVPERVRGTPRRARERPTQPLPARLTFLAAHQAAHRYWKVPHLC